ncbi:Hypothetical protein CINCED_3A011500 [Cinara cedri]|uniref:Uncharacterized protein n=1 Tax=Cinara cedri TaxID=506608 RepID=A0A5E4N2V0_9HEMI|nr:Hypothetical protein CINCED_3A011500 [Cinara cedri]
MLPNTISVSSTLPRVKNKTYDQNTKNVSNSKSADFQNDRKSWPLAQVVECVTIETVPDIIPPLVKENGSNVINPIPSQNGSVTGLPKDNLTLDCIKESHIDNQKNVLKIILPLVNENVPLNCTKTIEHDQLLYEKDCILSSNNYEHYSPKHCVDMSVYINKNINKRNYSLPEDSELNRFSSTFENIKSLLKEGLVDGLDEMPPDFLPPNPPLLYRVSSLPNLLSHNSTNSHNSCLYLTMCATKHELIMSKLCKKIVAKHDMSVQVSTELLKNQNQKILVDTSCQTEDIFINNCLVNDKLLYKETNHNICHTNINVLTNDCEIKLNNDNEMKNNINEDCISIGYTNIKMFNIEHEIKTNEEENLSSFDYSDVNIFNKDHEVSTNEEDCTSVGYININDFNKEKVRTNKDDCFSNGSSEKIALFEKVYKMKSSEDCPQIDYTNINSIASGNEVCVHEEGCSKIGYTNINIFDKEVEAKMNEEDCVDVGYTNFSLYDKDLEVDSNDECENYVNANILKEFVNEQLSINNVDGDFDSFLFGPLPPSPIEEIVSELSVLNSVETKRENSAPVPFMFDIHKNEPSTSIIKSRSIDAEFSHNFQQHQKIGTRSVQSERRTYPSEVPVSDGYPKPLILKTNIHPSTIEKLSDISSSLPDTPLLGRCDFPRQYSATSTKTMTQMSNSLSINMRSAGHGSNIGLGQAMAGAELLHLNGPGRGWYPRQRQFRPVSVEQLDKLASKSPVGHSQWDTREGHKPVTLPPNLTPKFFHRSPREALRRVTSLLIRKGNTNKGNKSKAVFSSSVIGPHGDISEECVTNQSTKRGFFKSFWRK